MEFTQLSLAGGGGGGDAKNAEGETTGLPMKRKWNTETSTSVDLQMTHPLPSDWEQCLDLQVTGKMYYANRKTGRKRWSRPEEQKLDLELNISAGGHKDMHITNGEWEDSSSSSSMGNNMVALACSNCHLLVILSRSSPSCPNCKYVHALASSSSSSITKVPHASIVPSNWRL